MVVLEAEERVGGRLASATFAGRVVDLGADAFLARRPEAVALCHQLGLDDQLAPAGTSGASVWARGRLRRLPDGLSLGVPTRWTPLARSGVLSAREALGVAGDLVRPHRRPEPTFGDRAVGDIVEGRLGRPVVDRLVDPLVGGIHAGSADELSAAALFPLLIAADQQPGSFMRRLRRAQPAADPPTPTFVSLMSGTASLADRLADALVGRVSRCSAVGASTPSNAPSGTGHGPPASSSPCAVRSRALLAQATGGMPAPRSRCSGPMP